MPVEKEATTRARDTIGRTVRGALQLGIAETILRVVEAFGPALTEDQHVALLGVLTLVVTLIQNVLENARVIPALLKKETP